MKVLQTLVAILAGLAPACFALAALASETPGFVVYQFPNVAGLGTLETRIDKLGAASLDRIASRRHVVATAVGTVKVPVSENRAVYFAPGFTLTKRPELLDLISPDNIRGFYFSFTSTGDSEDAIADQLAIRLSHFKNLQFLKLCRCDVSDIGIKGLHDLPQLRQLDMSYSLITANSMPVFGKLTSLEDITMNNVDLAHADLSYFGRLPKLNALYVRGSQITDSMLKQLKPCNSLEKLDLTNNLGISDASIATLAQLPKLKYLAVSGTSINLSNLTKLARVARIVATTRDLKGRTIQDWHKTIPNLTLDGESIAKANRPKPGAEELHLFAPTRY